MHQWAANLRLDKMPSLLKTYRYYGRPAVNYFMQYSRIINEVLIEYMCA